MRAGSKKRRKVTVMKFLHAMFRVVDLEASIRFYCEGLGFQLVSRHDYPEDMLPVESPRLQLFNFDFARRAMISAGDPVRLQMARVQWRLLMIPTVMKLSSWKINPGIQALMQIRSKNCQLQMLVGLAPESLRKA